MHEDLENEVEAINSIYGDGTIVADGGTGVYVLSLPNQDTSLRLQFDEEYPDVSPTVLGTHSSGQHTRRGDAAHLLELFREAVGRLFQPGEVCLYDVIEDVASALTSVDNDEPEEPDAEAHDIQDLQDSLGRTCLLVYDLEAPPWTLSDVVIELKSVFIARCAPVTSPDQAKKYLQHLLDTDKKVARATHNITAHRIKRDDGVVYQDCDDDGETAAGGRVLHLMQLMDLWNVMVVVTRWYGGHKLGPARFAIINSVARDSFVKAGLVHDQDSGHSKKKGKR